MSEKKKEVKVKKELKLTVIEGYEAQLFAEKVNKFLSINLDKVVGEPKFQFRSPGHIAYILHE
jgi:hypothetical protein